MGGYTCSACRVHPVPEQPLPFLRGFGVARLQVVLYHLHPLKLDCTALVV